MRLYLLVILLLAVPAWAAIEAIDVSFNIQQDLSVKETIAVAFDAPPNTTFIDYSLEEQVTSLEVKDSKTTLRHELLKTGGGYVLRIYPQGDDKLFISFISKNLVFQNNNIYQFFTELSFSGSKKLDVTATLPEGFGIYQASYAPDDGIISSNGRNIEVSWSFVNLEEPVIFSVKFERLAKEFNLWLLTPFVAIAGFLVYTYYRKRYREYFLLGFRDDERKVIGYMEKHSTAYQNKIEHEFKFSRAKMTRIVQKLEQNKLLQKKRKGRTNKLMWLGK